MRASFSSRDADNHTAFIRIKTNASNEDEFIILPVEVEVTTGQFQSPCLISCDQYYCHSCLIVRFVHLAPGIYSSTEMLDFGTLRSQGVFFTLYFMEKKEHIKSRLQIHFSLFTDRPKLLNLHLLNSGAKDVSIMVSVIVGLARFFISSINKM